MSVVNEISRIKTNIKNAYVKASEKGAILPDNQNSDNLASTIESITGGGNDMLQTRINVTPHTQRLFYQYTGDNVDYISDLDTSNVTDMSYMFAYSSNLKTVPLLNTSNVTNMGGMFNSCDSLENIPKFDTGNVTVMSSMFYNCDSLTTIPELDTKNVTNMSYIFYNCKGLTELPSINTSKVTDMSAMFQNCESLIEVPELDTSGVTNMYSLFTGCRNLITISGLDMSSVTNATQMFNSCVNLENLKLTNIKSYVIIGSISWGNKITVDSLIGIVQELIDTGVSNTLVMGTTNIAKLTDVYVKLLPDDGSGKLPCEVCQSTDEGAMLITNYVGLKNWGIA